MAGWLDWALRDRRTGEITVAQSPNAPLWGFILATVAGWAAPAGGTAETAFRVMAGASLFVWAADELLRGVNPFRRALGSAVLLYLGARVVL